MPAWLEIIVNILLFIVSLSFLILVHEAGHFATAKIFNVYCADFSIGFGKAFFSKKRKGGETSFSLRIFPLGGFVAMAGEEGEVEEGLNIPPERTINGIAKWKAAIVMSAGIIVNIIVSILLLYISNQAFRTEGVYTDTFRIKEDSIAEKAGLKTFNEETRDGNFISVISDPRTSNDKKHPFPPYSYYSLNSYINYDNGESKEVTALIDMSKLSLKKHALDHELRYFEPTFFDQKINDNLTFSYKVADVEKEITAEGEVKKEAPKKTFEYITFGDEDVKKAAEPVVKNVTLKLNTYMPTANKEEAEHSYYCTGCGEMITNKDDLDIFEETIDGKTVQHFFHKNCAHHTMIKKTSENGVVTSTNLSPVIRGVKVDPDVKPLEINIVNDKDGNKTFEDIGLSLYKHGRWQSFGEAWTNTFKQFGQGSALIFTTLGKLFIGQGWDQVGSIISIYNQQSMIMSSFGAQQLFYYWGLISVNLAIFNLLPLPGLDGWQLLVIAVEGITRKKIPDKVKTIMSYVGLALIFGLMIVLIVKDIIGLF